MEAAAPSPSSYYYYAGALLLALLFLLRRKQSAGPLALPIIGHLYLLKPPPGRTLAALAARYGDVIRLRFGSRPVLVVSSAAGAEECFATNDVVFCNRPPALSNAFFSYNFTTIFSAPYGPHWRNLRRLASLELFSPGRIASLGSVRTAAMASFIRSLLPAAAAAADKQLAGFHKVELTSRLREMSYNIVAEMLMGRRYRIGGRGKEDEEDGRRLRHLLLEVIEVCGLSVADMMPWLRWFGVGWSHWRKVVKTQREFDALLQRAVEGCRRDRLEKGDDDKNKTLVDVMLDKQRDDPGQCSDDIIKGVIQDLLMAGTSTSAEATEWAMALLLNHPDVLAKADAEIADLVGGQRLVTEADLPRLPYLNSIIMETLRLYPVGAVPPHHSSAECTVQGVRVAPGTLLLVNTYAIQHDPRLWPEPEAFKPERFMERGADGKLNAGFKHIPFGAGRRRCPGEALGTMTVAWVLALLVQCFEWKRVGDAPVDLTGGPGLTMPKALPLEAMLRPRMEKIDLLSQL